jgi:DNA-binding helix-hairpin-helix protein with protein kinase domain
MSGFRPGGGITVYASDDRRFVLDQEVGRGGEGSVWSIDGHPSVVAKFYHKGLAHDRAQKVEAMCRLKSDSLLRIAAWPTTILKPSASGSPQGLLMPRISGYQEAHLLYTPKSRRTSFPEAQLPFILHATVNIARAFATVHEADQVIGDVNHGNLLISRDATVALIDCDSFEINDGKRIYPCLVGVPTYTPPELQGQSFGGVRRTKQHDTFGLAVLIFHMLFLGRHPFAGIFRQGTADKTIEDAIREYRFAYLPDPRVTEMFPPPSMLTLAEFPREIGQLFIRSFSQEGSTGHRPSAHEWIAPLESLARNLKRCVVNETHHYFQALASCPWCRVEQAFGRAMFGIKIIIGGGEHFDIGAVWAQIESVRSDEQSLTPPSTSSFTRICTLDPRIVEVKKERRLRRLLGAGAILLAVIVVVPGWTSALPSILILVLGIATMAKLWHSGQESVRSFTRARKNAAHGFNSAMRRWFELQSPPTAFSGIKQRLQMERDEFVRLPAVKAQRLAELNSGLRQKQLTRYLEQHRIEDASIPGIGSGRKTLLRCYNVEDASDVELSRLNIKGFGPSLKSALLAWRISVEKRFVFDPNAGIDPTDLRMLEQELAQKRSALIQSLTSGSQQLRQVLLPWQIERSKLVTSLETLARRFAQAEVDMKALGRF